MLQRKLLVSLGSLIALAVLATVSGIAVLHSVLEDLVHASTAAVSGPAPFGALEAADTVAGELQRLQHQPGPPTPELAQAVTDLEAQVGRLEGPDAAAAAPGSPGGAEELQRLVTKFRLFGLVAGIVSLVLLNVSIIVLLRAATTILRPVNQLVDASRHLGREEFEWRVQVDQNDEFAELARAYNALAAQLQTNEQRKVEVLHQVARTLNHELNNAISTIELQLTLMGRRSGGDQVLTEPLRQIHHSLGRMSRTIDSLKHVRKIVLTDYLSGVKMLDLARSVQEEQVEPGPAEVLHH